MTKKPSFEEYVTTQKKPSCYFCNIPERAEIDEVYKKGKASKLQVSRYLRDVLGYSEKSAVDETGRITGVSAHAVDRHYTQKHHYE